MKKYVFLSLLIAGILFYLLRPVPAEDRHICLCGNLYYDWNGRPMGMLVPVLKDGDMIECEDKE